MVNKLKKSQLRAASVANGIGTLGYISVLFQWVWTLLILCYPLLIADHSILLPDQPRQSAQPVSDAITTSPIVITVAIMATLFVLVLTVVVLIRLPKAIGQRGASITHNTAGAIMPIVSKHLQLPEKKQRELSYKVIVFIKICIVLLPLLALVYIPDAVPVDGSIVWIIAIFCAIWSIICFGLQQLIVKLFKVPIDKLW